VDPTRAVERLTRRHKVEVGGAASSYVTVRLDDENALIGAWKVELTFIKEQGDG